MAHTRSTLKHKQICAVCPYELGTHDAFKVMLNKLLLLKPTEIAADVGIMSGKHPLREMHT